MRIDSSTSTPPPPLAMNWRMILWAMTLAPALLILGWSLRQARLPKPEFGSAGLTADETQRLKRILKESREAASSPLRGDAIRVVAASADTGAGEPPAPQVGSEVRLDRAILAAIKDNTFGVTAAEKPAYDAILAKVRNTPLAELEAQAHKDVPFARLMLDADRLRGELLTIEGDVRRINRLELPVDEPSADETFDAWLFTVDSGLHPYRVVLTSHPGGIPLGDHLQPPIRARVTGYFFKRYSYATANDFHTAPLLLAKTLTPLGNPASAVVPSTTNSRSLTYLAIGILVAFVTGGFVVEIIARRRSRRRDRPPEVTPDSPPDFSWLNRP
jgi:hypothetical protein